MYGTTSVRARNSASASSSSGAGSLNRRSTRTARSTASSRRSRGAVAKAGAQAVVNNSQRSTAPAQKWVKVLRPPATNIKFMVEKWVALTDLTATERSEYEKLKQMVSGQDLLERRPNVDVQGDSTSPLPPQVSSEISQIDGKNELNSHIYPKMQLTNTTDSDRIDEDAQATVMSLFAEKPINTSCRSTDNSRAPPSSDAVILDNNITSKSKAEVQAVVSLTQPLPPDVMPCPGTKRRKLDDAEAEQGLSTEFESRPMNATSADFTNNIE